MTDKNVRDIVPSVLSIAGTDPLCGAGTAADLAVFRSFGWAGLAVETAWVAQNSQGVFNFVPSLRTTFLERLQRVIEDCQVVAIKIGMTASPDILTAIVDVLSDWPDVPPVILDPVRTGGASLAQALHQGAFDQQFDAILPHVCLITPNAHELGALTGITVETLSDAIRGAEMLHRRGARAVLIKGGHLENRGRDFLSVAGDGVHPVYRGREWGVDIHGTGCHLSSAITCEVANGQSILDACKDATAWLHRLVEMGAYHRVGQGRPQFDARRLHLGFPAACTGKA